MKTILAVSMLAFAVACGGSTGDAGTAGTPGPIGPQGPQGPQGAAQIRLRLFQQTLSPSQMTLPGTATVTCPADSHAVGGGCACASSDPGSPAHVTESLLLASGTGSYFCHCDAAAGVDFTATAQVTCIDGAAATVVYPATF